METCCPACLQRGIGNLPFVGHRLYLLHAFAPKSVQRPENFSKFLNSFRLLSRSKPQPG